MLNMGVVSLSAQRALVFLAPPVVRFAAIVAGQVVVRHRTSPTERRVGFHAQGIYSPLAFPSMTMVARRVRWLSAGAAVKTLFNDFSCVMLEKATGH
jgi:hypothetical protein